MVNLSYKVFIPRLYQYSLALDNVFLDMYVRQSSVEMARREATNERCPSEIRAELKLGAINRVHFWLR